MPILRVDGPPIADLERRRTFVSAVTEAASSYFDLPKETVIVVIQETAPENVGLAAS